MTIRIAKDENDSKSASRIYAMSWKSGYKGIFSDELLDSIPLDRWVPHFNDIYGDDRYQLAIMSVDGEDVGAGTYGVWRDYDDPEIGEIGSIYFLDKAWGTGGAKMLMGFMLERLRERGFTKVHVWVAKDNLRACRFYEKCGFSLSGNEKPDNRGGEEFINVEYVLY